MDCESLIESLWRDSEAKIRAIEVETAEEVSKVEEEICRETGAVKEKCERNALSDTAKRTGDILADAEQRADLIRISASRKLSDRLYLLARASLPLLRNEEYGDVFAALTEDLPSLSWKHVRVHPGDLERAEKSFPGAEIICDDTITGGMDVKTGDGRIRVVNTFEKRLERAWEDLRSDLLRVQYEAL